MLDRTLETMSWNLSSDLFQDTQETCITKGLLFDEQRSSKAGKVCFSEYVLDLCEDGWGSCLIAVL